MLYRRKPSWIVALKARILKPALMSMLLTWARGVRCFYYHIGNLENLENHREGEGIIYVCVRP